MPNDADRSRRNIPDEAERAALTKRFGLVRIDRMEARIELIREAAGASATGRLQGEIVQSCAVSGEDLPVSIDEPVNLKAIIYGGGPMYVADSLRALDCFGPRLVQIYGQGEAPMTITVLPVEDHFDDHDGRRLERLGSVGRAQTGVEMAVLGSDDVPLPAGEIGEVCVRGDIVMAGYLNNPRATASALANGWLHTGDLGRLDERGYLTLVDRSKDLIISGGSNIYPREVEEVLLLHPAIKEVAVIGVPDAQWGESVVAAVVKKDPEACVLAEAMLTELLGVPVRERCQKGLSPRCCFEVATP